MNEVKKTKVPIGAHALLTFGEKPIVITADYIAEAEKWFDRSQLKEWHKDTCAENSWMVLFNGAYQSTDYDPTERYMVERGRWDRQCHVTDTTRIAKYSLSETKFRSLARCYLKPHADAIVKALNGQLKTARRKNG